MDRLKSSIVPVLLIVVFGIAFAAGIKSLQSRAKEGEGSRKSSGTGKLDFAPDTETAFARAEKEGKLVMVKYGAEWCGPCVQMKEEAFTDGEVADALANVIVVDIDVDAPGADTAWLKDHDAFSLPTVGFYRADGSEIGKTIGYESVSVFVSEIEKIVSKA